MAREEFRTGVLTIGTAAARLTVPGFVAHDSVFVQADSGNNDYVYVGHDGNVSAATGYPLDAGEWIEITIDDPSKIWVIGGAASQGVRYLWA